MPNCASNARSTSTGSDAPPEMHVRSEEVSGRWPRGTASIALYIVGTPRKTLTRSRSIIASALAGSKRGSSVRQAPAIRPAFIAAVWPKLWNSGSAPRITSSSVSRISVSSFVFAFTYRFACVSSAPFGLPVVPDV